MPFELHPLPLSDSIDLESRAILRQLARSHRHLAELKGAAATIPNETILIDTLALQEARDSSAIENIITTQDDLFQADAISGSFANAATKEVHNYAAALKIGFDRVRQQKLIRLEDILAVQSTLEQNRAELRKLPGTVLKNQQTGEVVYEPPQSAVDVERLMDNFVVYLNRDEPSDPDPLIRMAVLHFQFESIHPFYDGNGRTGRILNLLFLVLHGLLDIPVLYLSRYIVRNKADYYHGFAVSSRNRCVGRLDSLHAPGSGRDVEGDAGTGCGNPRAHATDEAAIEAGTAETLQPGSLEQSLPASIHEN